MRPFRNKYSKPKVRRHQEIMSWENLFDKVFLKNIVVDILIGFIFLGAQKNLSRRDLSHLSPTWRFPKECVLMSCLKLAFLCKRRGEGIDPSSHKRVAFLLCACGTMCLRGFVWGNAASVYNHQILIHFFSTLVLFWRVIFCFLD